MKHQTQETIDHCDLGFKNIPIRFFIIEQDDETGDWQEMEVNEAAFLDAEGVIEYERHTIHANGCRQICLTKSPWA